MDIKKLIRPNIASLKPYTSARSLFTGNDALLLDANENGADLFGDELNRYPDPLQTELKKKLADLKKIQPENLFLGNGSDEAIDLLLRIFCRPALDEVLICPPTYGMYEVQANIHEALVKKVLLTPDFQLQPEEILEQSSAKSKLLFLCSPNNPTGNLMHKLDIEILLNRFPGIVVIDEAYGDFSGESWANRIAEYPNLVVLQTLSKAWALAGVRLGLAISSPAIIGLLNVVKYPYNISKPNQSAALKALAEPDKMHTSVKDIEKQRQLFVQQILQLEFVREVYPSDANFLLVKCTASKVIFDVLKKQNIIVRDRSNEPLCENCLRFSIGTKSQNELLLKALKNIDLSKIAS